MSKTILATNSAQHFNLSFGQLNMGRFSGGEVAVRIEEDLKGVDTYIIGSLSAPGENLIELLLTCDTARRMGAGRITLVIPYFAYSRADREKFPGDAISAETMVKLIETTIGENSRVLTFDIHSPRMTGFFKIPFESVDVSDLFAGLIKDSSNITVLAPDKGAEGRAKNFADKIGSKSVAVVLKERLKGGEVEIKGVEGEVNEKVVMIDDIIDSGGTILKGAEYLAGHGVKDISVIATHMVWKGEGYKKLADSELIGKIYTTDTIAPPGDLPEKIKVFSVSSILQNLIKDSQLE